MERDFFKPFNHFMLLLWHAGLGGPMNLAHRLSGRILVLGTVGRRSGQMRRTPLNYAPDGEDVLVMAGFGAHTDWYRNLQTHPFAELWLPDGSWLAQAQEVQEPNQRLDAIRRILQDSGFASKTFAGLDAWKVSAETLMEETAGYEVVRLRILEPLPEPQEMKVGRAARLGLGVGLAISLAWHFFKRGQE